MRSRIAIGTAGLAVAAAVQAADPIPLTFDPPPKTTWRPDGCRSVPSNNPVIGSRDRWRMLHSDTLNSDEVTIALAPVFEHGWQAEPNTFNVTVPVFDNDGNLYFSPFLPYEDITMISLDPLDGSRRWAIPANNDAPVGAIAPMVLNDPDNPGNEIIYQVLYDRALAVRPDASIVWDVPTGLTLSGILKQDTVTGINYLPQADAIVALTTNGHLYALDRETGDPLLAAPYSLPGEPSGEGAGLALPQNIIDAVDAEITQLVNFPPGTVFEDFLASILGNEIEVSNSFSIDPNTGRMWIAATAPDADDGTVDGVSELGALYAIDLVPNGPLYDVVVVCMVTYDGGSASTPGVRTDGTRIYFGDNEGNLIALDSSCNELWSLDLGSQITGSVTVATDNGEIYASTVDDIFQVLDEGVSASLGWTAEIEAYLEAGPGRDNYNMLLASAAANGIGFMAGVGTPPGQLATVALPIKIGYGVLDRVTGKIRYFADGLDESVAELNSGPDGAYYNANSPIRHAFTNAVFPGAAAPIEGGIRKFEPRRIDLLVRDAVCAASDRADNAAATALDCPASSAADSIELADLIAQARRMAPAAITAGDLSQVKWDRVDAFLTAADHARACATISPCPAAPRVGCRVAAESKLNLKRKEGKVPNADTVSWSWKDGAATTLEEFSDPLDGSLDGADYGVCVYAGAPGSEELVYEVGLPASPDLWTAKPPAFVFKDKVRAERGMKLAQLTAGTLASVKVKAKGAQLPAGVFVIQAPVTVQLVNGESELCWESAYAAGDVKKTDLYGLKAQF